MDHDRGFTSLSAELFGMKNQIPGQLCLLDLGYDWSFSRETGVPLFEVGHLRWRPWNEHEGELCPDVPSTSRNATSYMDAACTRGPSEQEPPPR
jgi:hypothetical protein